MIVGDIMCTFDVLLQRATFAAIDATDIAHRPTTGANSAFLPTGHFTVILSAAKHVIRVRGFARHSGVPADRGRVCQIPDAIPAMIPRRNHPLAGFGACP